MSPAFERLQQQLKQLPGLGYRSAERIALHLLVEKPARLPELVAALQAAAAAVRRCERCGNLAEGPRCAICADERRDPGVVCVVEHVPDLVAIERSDAPNSVIICFGLGVSGRIFRPASGRARTIHRTNQSVTAKTT